MLVKIIGKFNAQSFPLDNTAIEIDEETLRQIGKTKCFDVERNCVIDYDNKNELKIEEYNREYLELKRWFGSYYSMHIEKYTRLIALNKVDDDLVSPETKLKELYYVAEDKRKRIQDLEELLSIYEDKI